MWHGIKHKSLSKLQENDGSNLQFKPKPAWKGLPYDVMSQLVV